MFDSKFVFLIGFVLGAILLFGVMALGCQLIGNTPINGWFWV